MKTLIVGGGAAILGIVGLSIWFGAFLQVVAGVVPITLLLGGGLALYLGFDEIKDALQKRKEDKQVCSSAANDVEQYKSEIDELKKEVETLKTVKA